MKNKLLLVVALLVGLLAFWLSNRYLIRERIKLYAGAEKVKVLVANRDLPAMTVLTIEDLGMRSEFKSAVGQNVFLAADSNKIIGKRLKYPVKRKEMLQWSYVDITRYGQTGLAPIIAKGKRAMSISVSGAPSVSGLVHPNDHVDILGTFTFPSRTNPQQVESVTLTLMQDVTVLATGQQLARQTTMSREAPQAGYSMVTFELFPEEAELLVFAQQTRGQLYLTLRNPDDISAKEFLPSVNFDYLEAELERINERRQLDNRRGAPEAN